MIKKPGRTQLLTIANRHPAPCGAAPSLSLKDEYVSYFESHGGDQWVFVGDRATGEAELYGGDVEWTHGHPVSREDPFPGFALQDAERFWLITCLMALADASLDEIVTNYNAAVQKHMDETDGNG